MADDKKSYTEDEHVAILSDRVSKETAELTGKVSTLETEKSDLESQLDVANVAKEAAETKAADAEKALADYKTEVEDREAAAAKKDGRLTELRESAKHLKDDFLDEATETGKARVARIVAMSDESFAGYKADLASTGADLAPGSGDAHPPRETAMGGATTTTTSGSAAKGFLMRGRLVDAGASKEA